MTGLDDDRRAAAAVAREAGAALLAAFAQPPKDVRTKSSPQDLVSAADLEAERLILDEIARHFPEDGALSEEAGERGGTSGRRWIIDPLDGTTNFLACYPHWCVSICIEDQDGPRAGAIFDPVRDELFSAARNEGCTLGKKRLSIGKTVDLKQALVAVDLNVDHYCSVGTRALLTRVLDWRTAGSIALDLAWVAAGRLDLCIYRHRNTLWDFAAGELLVREAGGSTRPAPLDIPHAVFSGRELRDGVGREQ